MSIEAYLQTWTDGGQAALEREGEQLDYAASNQYPRIGLRAGDVLHIGYLEDGFMHLIGAHDGRRGDWSLRSTPAPGRRHLGERVVRCGRSQVDWADPAKPVCSLSVVRELRFRRNNGEITRLNPDPTGRLDGKALQSIRRLTPQSAELLGALL
ncbi:MAG: hypothetical protein U0R51_01625 [Solirubrobacterales bacterium]